MKKKSSLRKPPGADLPWARALGRRARALGAGRSPLGSRRQLKLLREGIRILAQAEPRAARGLELAEQPFDRHLLALSPLYRRSRAEYLGGGGRFAPALVSSPRTLSSPILLSQLIEYSPIASELAWAATDPGQTRDDGHLLRLRTYSSSLFHEQSHRILWRLLPRPPRDAAGLRRYLNFVESLVITLDMALGDELGSELSAVFYLSGVLYDPGTPAREGLSRRDYRNYLQAALHATYLCLELYAPDGIPEAIGALFANQPEELWGRATRRALNLDRGFVTRTNPVWQRCHRKAVLAALSRLPGPAWAPPVDPLDHREQYLLGEQWFARFGL